MVSRAIESKLRMDIIFNVTHLMSSITCSSHYWFPQLTLNGCNLWSCDVLPKSQDNQSERSSMGVNF